MAQILLIDDDPDFREFVKLALEDWGLECLEAQDCASALDVVDSANGSIEVVLLDYFMRGMTPECCVRALRERLGDEVPIVLVSAAVDIVERAFRIGIHRVLAKPFGLEELRATVGLPREVA